MTTVQVGSQVSGIIATLYADFNTPVKKGQLLAELDPTPFQAQVEQRQADARAGARCDLRNARDPVSAGRQLLEQQGLAPEADYDAAQADFDGPDARRSSRRRPLLTRRRRTSATRRSCSPIDGVVVARQYDIGQTVAASFQAPTLFTIAQDLTKMQVQADVDQSDIGRIQLGQTARSPSTPIPDEEFRGHDRAGPPERDGEPERRDLPRHRRTCRTRT